MTVREEILAAARDLTLRGLTPFSPADVIQELRRRGTTYEESSIRTHVVNSMCVDAGGTTGGAYPDLRRVGRGEYVLADTAGAAVGRRTREGEAGSTLERPWNWEGHVQYLVVAHLGDAGWRILATADTARRESGVDVHAERDGVELIVEVKGYPGAGAATAPTQARHYVGGALLTGLLAWADRPSARILLVFPESTTYRRLAQRLRVVLERLEVSWWFVHEDGRIERWLDYIDAASS